MLASSSITSKIPSSRTNNTRPAIGETQNNLLNILFRPESYLNPLQTTNNYLLNTSDALTPEAFSQNSTDYKMEAFSHDWIKFSQDWSSDSVEVYSVYSGAYPWGVDECIIDSNEKNMCHQSSMPATVNKLNKELALLASYPVTSSIIIRGANLVSACHLTKEHALDLAQTAAKATTINETLFCKQVEKLGDAIISVTSQASPVCEKIFEGLRASVQDCLKNQAENSSLSGGAKAGIVIGVLAATGFVAYCFRRPIGNCLTAIKGYRIKTDERTPFNTYTSV